MNGLSGRVALVTGGVGLLGSAIVGRLLTEGAVVGFTSRDIDRVRHSADRGNEKDTGRLIPLQMELSDEQSRRDALNEFAGVAGSPSILIANASFRDGLTKPFDALQTQDLAALFDVDVSGHLALARDFVDKRDGAPASIVFISSIYGTLGVDPGIYPEGMAPTPVQYVAAKSALLGVTRYLAALWGRQGVRVNSVISGGILNATRQSPEFVQRYSSKTMLGRMAQPDEIAASVAFLVSDDAAYVTGHHMVVDGGYSAW